MGWLSETLDKRNEALWSKLVPFEGRCDTVEGETLRAINRIIYRRYNDGDYFYKGYGAEGNVAGSAHAYLVKACPIKGELKPILDAAVDGSYEESLNKALTVVLDWIEGREEYTKNEVDMFDFSSQYHSYEDSYYKNEEEEY
jgi:hypothetical protein